MDREHYRKNPSQLSKLSEVLQVIGDKSKAEISAFNAANSPVIEWSEEDCVCGAFVFDNRVFYGTKYKNGYHPTKLVAVPDAVVVWLKKGAK